MNETSTENIGRVPKILFFDLEVTPLLVWTYNAYEGNALRIEEDSKIMSVAWAWGDGKIQYKGLHECKGYKPSRFKINDSELVELVYDLIEEADLVIGQNSINFDMKVLRARALAHKLPPLKPVLMEDTLKIAKRYFKLPKYTLEELCRYVGIEGKTELKHSDLLWGYLEGDTKKGKLMKAYNVRDVEITRKFYNEVKGWHLSHTNLNFIYRRPLRCPTCLSEKYHKRGFDNFKRTGTRQRYICQECGKNFYGPIIKDGYSVGQY